MQSPLHDKNIQICGIACLLGVLGFLLWSSFAKLEEGVTASGQIVLEANRKKIQHLEGGMISALHISEGQIVERDAILLDLEPLQSETARDELAQEVATLKASLIRLYALKSGTEEIDFGEISHLPLSQAVQSDLTHRQSTLFKEQRDHHKAELNVLRIRKETIEGQQQDLKNQITAVQNALKTAMEDLQLRQQLLVERLDTVANVNQVKREVSSLKAELSRLVGDHNQALKGADEVQGQIDQTQAQFQESIGQQIIDMEQQAFAANERLSSTQDRLSRTVIRAPQSGTVLNLAHSTIGGVIGAGEVIMEIVPNTDNLIASVQLTPLDRDAVQVGQEVEAQLSAYKSFIAPRLPGVVLGVSADLKQDQATGIAYYEARIELDASQLDPNSRVEIMAGMPVDAFIASGNTRSFLDYVFEPILATFTRGTRMSS